MYYNIYIFIYFTTFTFNSLFSQGRVKNLLLYTDIRTRATDTVTHNFAII